MIETYHMLECFVPEGETIVDIVDYPFLDGIDSWMSGCRFGAPPPAPIKLAWDPNTKGIKKMLYDATIPLFHIELLKALKSCGINNLDCYPVDIAGNDKVETNKNYVAVNVIGLVAAANLEKSNYTSQSGHLIDMDFDGLAISTQATRGLLLFRLAECVSGLVVHDSVKRFLEAHGGFGLSFIPPEKWIG